MHSVIYWRYNFIAGWNITYIKTMYNIAFLWCRLQLHASICSLLVGWIFAGSFPRWEIKDVCRTSFLRTREYYLIYTQLFICGKRVVEIGPMINAHISRSTYSILIERRRAVSGIFFHWQLCWQVYNIEIRLRMARVSANNTHAIIGETCQSYADTLHANVTCNSLILLGWHCKLPFLFCVALISK